MWSKKGIRFALVSVVTAVIGMCVYPTSAAAHTVTITANGISCGTISTATPDSSTSDTLVLNIAATTGRTYPSGFTGSGVYAGKPVRFCPTSTNQTDGFYITGAQAGTLAQLAAIPDPLGTQNLLKFRNMYVLYRGPANTTATLVISGLHKFTLASTKNVNTPDSRAYATGLSATFARGLLGTSVATNDFVQAKGFFRYVKSDGVTLTAEDQIGTTLSCTVGGTCSNGQPLPDNTIPTPGLLTSEGARDCANLLTSGTCKPDKEQLRTEVTLRLLAGDTASLSNSDNVGGGDHTLCVPDPQRPNNRNFDICGDSGSGLSRLEQTIRLLTNVAILYQQNTPVSIIRPGDNGTMQVLLLGLPEFFDVNNVVLSSLTFGPLGAEPVKNETTFRDVDNDGVTDIAIKFLQQDTGIECGMTFATLDGLYDDPEHGQLPFSATGGFATDC